MKKGIFLLLCGASLLGIVSSCAVTKTPQDILLDQALHREAVQAIQNSDFVLEADRLEFRRGGVANVADNTNFISVRDNRVTIQTAFNNARSGANNLGGVTFDGNLSNMKITRGKGGNLNISFNSNGAIFSGRVEMTLYAGSNEASATIYPTFSGNKLTLNGVVIPAEESQVFKGRSF